MGFLGGSNGQESTCNSGEVGLNPGSRRFPGKGIAPLSSILASRIPSTEGPGYILDRGGYN